MEMAEFYGDEIRQADKITTTSNTHAGRQEKRKKR
jgi:hypothetical protein